MTQAGKVVMRLMPAAVLVALLSTTLVVSGDSLDEYSLAVQGHHPPWSSVDVDRFVVSPGNCMAWTATVYDADMEPVPGVAVSVTDTDGRRSVVYSGTSGSAQIGTRTCWSTPHVADHAFQVTGHMDGRPATSNKVLHEVMWTLGQVYAQVPANGEGSVEIPVWVVWVTTNEPLPVDMVQVRYGNVSMDVPLEQGHGVFEIDVDPNAQLRIGAPVEKWPPGGPTTTIEVQDAGPFTIPPPGESAAGGGGAEGEGPPPDGSPPPRGDLPHPATPDDHEALPRQAGDDSVRGDQATDQNEEGTTGRRIPAPGGLLVVTVLLVIHPIARRWSA